MQRAYTSTVVGPIHLVLGVLCAGAFGVLTVSVGAPLWVSALGAVAMLLVSVHLSTVRLSIGSGIITLGQGPWNTRARSIPADSVVAATDADLRWPQVFGVGVRFHRKTQRMTVRPGPTLCLQLSSGEYVRISTKNPAAARNLLPTTRGEKDMEERKTDDTPSRPWFGSKRVGFGVRPQTWQGWAIVLAVCAAFVIVMIARH
jgi:hypothetical protein